MLGLRIEGQGRGFKIDIQCDCGNSAMKNEYTGGYLMSHYIEPGSPNDTLLRCDCGQGYRLKAQSTHVHVETRAS